MQQQKKVVIVMENDPQVLKGLILLLEDMQFNVTPANFQHELANLTVNQAACPVLLVLPFELDNKTSGIELVKCLRTDFKHHIPAILLSHENGLSPDRFVDEDIVVLSDRISPKDLRRNISSLLSNTLAV